MSIKPKIGPDGKVLWFDVLAGTVRRQKIRKRFTVGKAQIPDAATRRSHGLKSTSTPEEHALAAAKLWELRKREQIAQSRFNVVSVPTNKLPEIIRALELLEPYEGTTIDQVVREWISAKARTGETPWTFYEAVEACIQAKRDLLVTEHHLRPLEVKMRRIALVFGHRYCDEIKTDELVQYARCRAKTPHTWRNYRRDLGIIFNFATQRGRASSNPAKNMPKPQFLDKAPAILSVIEARNLLRICNVNLSPFVALGLFAGLRPFEIVRLKPEDINLEARLITVSGKRSRSRSRRHVTIASNLALWLSGWTPTPRTYWNVRDAIQEASAASGVKLAPDVFRHSFASHHLALHKNAALTSHEMGHQNQETLFRNYRDLVTEQAAKDYFAICPNPQRLCETADTQRTVFRQSLSGDPE